MSSYNQTSLRLLTNYFQIELQNTQITQYNIDLIPKVNFTELEGEYNKQLQSEIDKIIKWQKSYTVEEFEQLKSEGKLEEEKQQQQKIEGKRPLSQAFQDNPGAITVNYKLYSTSKQGQKEYCYNQTVFVKPRAGSSPDSNSTGDLNEHQIRLIKSEIPLDVQSPEARSLLGFLVKRLMYKVKLIRYGRKYFDPDQRQVFDQYELSLMRGYDTAVSIKRQKVLLQVDTCVKLIRNESYLHVIKGVRPETQEYQELIGGIVQSQYGNHQFVRIHNINYDLTPEDTFEVKVGPHAGKKISYVQYYYEKYNITIKHTKQPMIETRRKQGKKNGVQQEDKVEYFVPELMNPTGETKEHKANFRLQADLGRAKHVPPFKKLSQCTEFLNTIKKEINNENQQFKSWGIHIQENSITVDGTKIRSGELILGKSKIDIEKGDLDRETQAPLLVNPFDQKGIDRMLVLYSSRSQSVCDAFLSQFQQSVSFMQFPINAQPKCVPVNDRSFRDWEDIINQYAKGAQLVVCILPGPKKKGRFYNELKLLLTNTIGVFSQMIIEATVKNQKGLRVVCNKLVLKITSKTGGVPYSISEIPDRFSKQPTMVCGIDIYHNKAKGKYSIISLVATVDQKFAKYYSHAELKNGDNDITGKITVAMRQAIDAFGRANKCAPKNIIVYRDGVSDGQIKSVMDNEVQGCLRAIEHFGQRTEKTKLAFIIVNKRINSKLFSSQSSDLSQVQNPLPGSCISNTAINDDRPEQTDYLLVSAKAKQGVAGPTHYRIIFNNLLEKSENSSGSEQSGESMEKELHSQIHTLTYKLCYLYYNCTHAIKMPAPAKLAHRMANYIGDKYIYPRNETFIAPTKELLSFNSLYYL